MSAFLSSIQNYLMPDARPKPRKDYMLENMKRLKQLQIEAKEKVNQSKEKTRLKKRRKAYRQPASKEDAISKADDAVFVPDTPPSDVESSSNFRSLGVQTVGDADTADQEGVLLSCRLRAPSPPPLPGRANVSVQVQLHPSTKEDIPLKENGEIDYVRLNALKPRPLKTRKPLEKIDPTMAPSTYQKGVLPRYLQETKKRDVVELQKRGLVEVIDNDNENDENLVCLSEEEKREHIKKMRETYAKLVSEMNALPMRSDSYKMKRRREELEEALQIIEDGIKMFSRHKLYIKVSESKFS